MGAILTERFGFRYCCDTVAVTVLIYSIAYYIFANGKQAFKVSRWKNFKEDQEEIQVVNVDKVTSFDYGYGSEFGFKNNKSIVQSTGEFGQEYNSKTRW